MGTTDTTRAFATLLRYADKHDAPAGFTDYLWTLRGKSHETQVHRLRLLRSAMQRAHCDAVAQGH